MVKINEDFASYENDHTVETYQLNGVGAWPLLRSFAVCRLYSSHNRNWHGVETPLRQTLLWHVARFCRRFGDSIALKFRDRAHEAKPADHQVDVLCIGNSLYRTFERDGKCFEIFMDSIADHLEEAKISFRMWEVSPNTHPRTPRFRPTAWIESKLSFMQGLSYLYSFLVFPFVKVPRWFSEFAPWLCKHTGANFKFWEIFRIWTSIRFQTWLISGWLRTLRPKIILLCGWHNYSHMAVTLAAKRLGIKTVDIQHGFITPENFAYCRWKKKPVNGYELYPDFLWVWSDREKQIIQEYNGAFLSKEQIVVGGHPWMNRWFDVRSSIFAKEIERVRALCSGPERTILVTMSVFLPRCDLLPAIQSSPPSWRWLIRFHPAYHEGREAMMQQIKNTGHSNIEMDEATRLSLYAVLQFVDAHVTFHSSSAVEALAFGLRTLLIIEEAKLYFEDYIAQDLMAIVLTKQEILEAIKQNKGNVTSGKAVSVSSLQTRETLRQLLNNSQSVPISA